MLGFSDTWRKRLACERCRQLKVRCEYSSPTNDTCIRCEKTHTPCIISTTKRKTGGASSGQSSQQSQSSSHVTPPRSQHHPITPSPEIISKDAPSGSKDDTSILQSKAEHAVYLQRIIVDAKRKLEEMNISPLTQALSTGFYTHEEVTKYYNQFLRNPCLFPAISVLNLPNDILEVDKKWPWLAIAIASTGAMNTTSKPIGDIMVLLQNLMVSPSEVFGEKLTLDRLAALCLICQYASINTRDRTLTALFHLHSMVVACVRKFHTEHLFEEEKIAIHLGAVTILPFIIIKSFSPLCNIMSYYYTVINYGDEHNEAAFFNDGSNCDCVSDQPTLISSDYSKIRFFTANLLIEMLRGYSRAVSVISNSTDIFQIRSTVECVLQSISLLENQAAGVVHHLAQNQVLSPSNEIPVDENLSLFPLRPCYIMAKLNILKLAVVRMLRLTISEASDSDATNLCFKYVISQGANHSSQLFRIFAYTNSRQPILPTTMYYYVPTALITLQLMRFASFASEIDIDVRSDCLTQVVTMKWEELIATSMMAKRLLLLLFPALDTSNVKIGEVSQEHSVIGSGLMNEFNIIFCNGGIKNIRETIRVTRESFIEVIQAVFRQKEHGNDRSPSWFENINTLSLPSVIHLLIFEF